MAARPHQKTLSFPSPANFPNPITHFPRPRTTYPARAARAYNARHEGDCSISREHAPHSGGGEAASAPQAKCTGRGEGAPSLRKEQLSCRIPRKPRIAQAESERREKTARKLERRAATRTPSSTEPSPPQTSPATKCCAITASGSIGFAPSSARWSMRTPTPTRTSRSSKRLPSKE